MADREPVFELDETLVLRAHGHIATGGYASIDEVLDAAFEALDRERAAFDERVRALIQEALDDPRPPVPVEEAFQRIRQAVRDRRGE